MVRVPRAEDSMVNTMANTPPTMQIRPIIGRLMPCTRSATAQRKMAPTTIKTMLHRLVRKKVLGYSEEKNRYQYFSRVKREDCVCKASQSFLERVFGGEAAPLLAHFVRMGPLSRKELSELRKILKEQEAKQ